MPKHICTITGLILSYINCRQHVHCIIDIYEGGNIYKVRDFTLCVATLSGKRNHSIWFISFILLILEISRFLNFPRRNSMILSLIKIVQNCPSLIKKQQRFFEFNLCSHSDLFNSVGSKLLFRLKTLMGKGGSLKLPPRPLKTAAAPGLSEAEDGLEVPPRRGSPGTWSSFALPGLSSQTT